MPPTVEKLLAHLRGLSPAERLELGAWLAKSERECEMLRAALRAEAAAELLAVPVADVPGFREAEQPAEPPGRRPPGRLAVDILRAMKPDEAGATAQELAGRIACHPEAVRATMEQKPTWFEVACRKRGPGQIGGRPRVYYRPTAEGLAALERLEARS